jgi:hypothetical protein
MAEQEAKYWLVQYENDYWHGDDILVICQEARPPESYEGVGITWVDGPYTTEAEAIDSKR